jgi:hypothetical protein
MKFFLGAANFLSPTISYNKLVQRNRSLKSSVTSAYASSTNTNVPGTSNAENLPATLFSLPDQVASIRVKLAMLIPDFELLLRR